MKQRSSVRLVLLLTLVLLPGGFIIGGFLILLGITMRAIN